MQHGQVHALSQHSGICPPLLGIIQGVPDMGDVDQNHPLHPGHLHHRHRQLWVFQQGVREEVSTLSDHPWVLRGGNQPPGPEEVLIQSQQLFQLLPGKTLQVEQLLVT